MATSPLAAVPTKDHSTRRYDYVITVLRTVKEVGEAPGVPNPLKAACGIAITIIETLRVSLDGITAKHDDAET